MVCGGFKLRLSSTDVMLLEEKEIWQVFTGFKRKRMQIEGFFCEGFFGGKVPHVESGESLD